MLEFRGEAFACWDLALVFRKSHAQHGNANGESSWVSASGICGGGMWERER